MTEISNDIVPSEGARGLPCLGLFTLVDGKYVDAGQLSSRNDKLIAAASECVFRANNCLQHCIVLLGQGNKTMAACAKSAMQLAAIGSALEQMAATESRHLGHLAKVVKEMCRDCEHLCKKFEKYPECKACGEACAVCYKECDLHLIRALFA